MMPHFPLTQRVFCCHWNQTFPCEDWLRESSALKSNFPLWRPPLLLQKHYACFSKKIFYCDSNVILYRRKLFYFDSDITLFTRKMFYFENATTFSTRKIFIDVDTTVSTWKLFHLDKDITISFHSTVQLLLYTLRAYFCTQWEPTSAHIKSLLLHTLRAYFCTH